MSELANIDYSDINLFWYKKFIFNEYKFFYIYDKLKKFIPLALIFNYTYFGKKKFYLDKACFLPRQDSYSLLLEILNFYNEYEFKVSNILDFCCGVGPLGLTFHESFLSSKLYGFDINQQALFYAKLNADLLVQKNTYFIMTNYLDYALQNGLKAEIILCNPPYIAWGEHQTLDNSVITHNPLISLSFDGKGLFFYEQLMKNINNIVANNFIIGLEINPFHVDDLQDMLKIYCKNWQWKFSSNLQNSIYFLIIYNI